MGYLTGYLPTVKFAGVQSVDVDEFEVSFEQKCQLWYPGGGTQDPSRVDYGERHVKVKFTARFDTDTFMGKLDNATDEAVVIDVQGPLIGGTTYNELNISLPVVSYDTVELDTSKDNVLAKIDGTARSTSAGNDKISLFTINTIHSYTL
jgi:hypothetical protein